MSFPIEQQAGVRIRHSCGIVQVLGPKVLPSPKLPVCHPRPALDSASYATAPTSPHHVESGNLSRDSMRWCGLILVAKSGASPSGRRISGAGIAGVALWRMG